MTPPKSPNPGPSDSDAPDSGSSNAGSSNAGSSNAGSSNAGSSNSSGRSFRRRGRGGRGAQGSAQGSAQGGTQTRGRGHQGKGERRGWSMGDFARGTAAVLAVYGIAKLLLFTQSLVFAAFLGILFGLAVAAGTDWLHRFRIPRALGAPGIVLAFLGLLVGFGIWTGPTVRQQYNELVRQLPQAVQKIDQWVGQHQDGFLGRMLPKDTNAASSETTQRRASVRVAPQGRSGQPSATTGDSLVHLKSIGMELADKVPGAARFVFPVISSTFAIVSGVVLIIFLAIYIGLNPDVYRRGIISLVPVRSRPLWEDTLTASASALRRWLTTQLIAMVVIGVVTTVVLMILDVKAALPLGILAGLLEFVPTIGPIISAVPAIAMAFVDSPEKAAVVALAYVGIQFVENNLLIPYLMSEGVDLPPVLTILTQAAMALVFGFMGLFVAVPALVLITMMVKKLYIEPQEKLQEQAGQRPV